MNTQTPAVAKPDDNNFLISTFKQSLREIRDGQKTFKEGVEHKTSSPLNNRELMQNDNLSMTRIRHSFNDQQLDIFLISNTENDDQFIAQRLSGKDADGNMTVIAKTFHKNGGIYKESDFDAETATKEAPKWTISGAP